MPRGRPRKVLGDANSQVIAEQILQENPESLDNTPKLVKMVHQPEYRTMIFENRRDPGQALYFHYCSGTHPLHQYTLYHGKPCTLPLEVIEHLEDRADLQYDYRYNTDMERSEMYVKSRVPCFSFRRPPKGMALAA